MIAYIKGSLEEKANKYVVVDVQGVGYKIFMAEPAINSLGEIGEKVKVYTYQQVREDDISLYGFLSNEELRMFELLISVSGVGAKSALTILANIEPSHFALAVITNDTSKLVKVPGIGAKSAARIVLELKDKIKHEQTMKENVGADDSVCPIETTNVEEAISALQVLGYNKREIEKTIQKLAKEELSVEELIKQGLKELSK